MAEEQNQSIWTQFNTDKVRFVDLGRAAVFLIPEGKLNLLIDGETVGLHLGNFLAQNFKAFTFCQVPYFGIWINGQEAIFADKCRLYEVSFDGKEKISVLGEKLAEIAKIIGEECIYFKAGQYSALVYPKP